MNRIAGIFSLDLTPVISDDIQFMLTAMARDDRHEQRTWVKGEVGLGCAGVEIAPGKDGDRLLWHRADQECTIAFDGRIDNRPELLAALKAQLSGRRPLSAEELVLAAYERWGLECPARLVGDFAFAIWDARKHRLICARDHFGVKPFYYYLSKNSFLFASTPYALLASGKVPPVLHEERIADFLVNPLEGVDKTSSFYVDVFRLPPAHMLIVRSENMTLERYWELCPKVQSGPGREDEYLEVFHELFTQSVQCRLQGVPIPASMLSGGMDSSAIVGLGRRILTEEGRAPLRAFAVISNLTRTNRETSHIASVLDQGNVRSHLISETELLQCTDELVKAVEAEAEPFDFLMNLNRAVYLHARDQKINVLLDGVDGDVLLADSGHLTQLWREGAYRTVIEETLKAEGLTAEYKLGRKEFINSLYSVISLFVPDWMRKLRRQHRYRRTTRISVRETIIDREFAIRSRLGERFARLDAHSPRSLAFTQTEFHKIALEHPFLTVGLERYERVASAFGIEARHPFTDVRLAEFCLGLPWQWKSRRGWTKMILRRALEPYLPPDVIWRRDKDSLMWDVNRLILKAKAEYFYQITLDEQANLKCYIDLQKLMKSWNAYLTLGDEKHAEWLWSGFALAMWLRCQRNMFGFASRGPAQSARPETLPICQML